MYKSALIRHLHCRSGDLGIETAMDLSSYLIDEHEYTPWKSFSDNMEYLDQMLAASPLMAHLSVSAICNILMSMIQA